MKNISAAELDEFVNFIDNDCNGDLSDRKFLDKYTPINFLHETFLDQSLDPFSEEYFQTQLLLYKEISGRNLNQWSGELHPMANVDSLINSHNPQGINNVSLAAENVRAISSMLSLSSLGDNAKVLDMGAGHGMSSEIYAFSGCDVHAIDIDPVLTNLSVKRSEMRSLKIKRSIINFDSLSSIQENFYDAVLFFQSFHHNLRPWKLIAELKTKLSREGVIAFCGEPVQNIWHKHWGIRMDEASLYVTHKFGWFESGWSREFITECFVRNGLELVLLKGGHQGGLIGITSKDNCKIETILQKAHELGFSTLETNESELISRNYQSQIGNLSLNKVRPSIVLSPDHLAGYACYGPYISLPSGVYKVSFVVSMMDKKWNHGISSLLFDVVSDNGKVTHYSQYIDLTEGENSRLVVGEFHLFENAFRLEARVFIPKTSRFREISLPLFERI